jgi:hypothetical protein
MERSLKTQVKYQTQIEKSIVNVDKLMGGYIEEMLNSVTSFHKLHLKVTGNGSYAQHKALNELYDALPDAIDSVAEGYQGACERLLVYPGEGPVILDSIPDAITYLRELHARTTNLQGKVTYSEVINNMDLIKDALNAAKYKLLFLE